MKNVLKEIKDVFFDHRRARQRPEQAPRRPFGRSLGHRPTRGAASCAAAASIFEGTIAELEAIPNPGYRFVCWKEDGIERSVCRGASAGCGHHRRHARCGGHDGGVRAQRAHHHVRRGDGRRYRHPHRLQRHARCADAAAGPGGEGHRHGRRGLRVRRLVPGRYRGLEVARVRVPRRGRSASGGEACARPTAPSWWAPTPTRARRCSAMACPWRAAW